MDREEMERIRALRLKKIREMAAASSAENSSTPSGTASPNRGLGDPQSSLNSQQLASNAGANSSVRTSSASRNNGTPASSQAEEPSVISTDSAVGSAPISTSASASTSNLTPVPTPVQSSPQPAPKAAPKTIPFEEWQDKTISEILRCSLHKDTLEGGFFYPEDLVSDLESSGQPLTLSADYLDALYMAAFQTAKAKNPLEITLSAWMRAERKYSSLTSRQIDVQKREVLDQIRETTVSYMIMALSEPDCGLFVPNWDPAKGFGELLIHPESKIISSGVLKLLVSKSDETPGLPDVLINGFRAGCILSTITSQPAQLLAWATQFPTLLQAMITWSPPPRQHGHLRRAREHPVEADSYLGPFFSASPLNSSTVTRYFDPGRMSRGAIDSASSTIQLELSMIWSTLFQSVDRMARNSETRPWILKWFAEVANQNHKRTAFQSAPHEICSDGFMINITVMLDTLCDPFTVYTGIPGKALSKIDSAEAVYFRRNPALDISDETKIGTDTKTSKEFYSKLDPGRSKPISDMFFTAVALHHYGLNSCFNRCEHYERMIKNLDSAIEEMRSRLSENVPPLLKTQIQVAVTKYQERRHYFSSLRNAIFAALMDKKLQEGAIRVTNFQMAWLLRLIDPTHQFPDKCLELPLPEEVSMEFKALPEYMIESAISHLKFVLSSVPHLLQPQTKSTIVAFCVTLLFHFNYITNPYLTSGLVTVLRYGLPYSNMPGPLDDDLKGGSTLASNYLMHALINIFIQVEHTGSSSQFYDKFSIRYEVFEVIDKLWDSDVYRESLVAECNKNMHFFVRFVNYLLNDATYLLDEAQAAFIAIHQLQDELDGLQNRDSEDSVRKEKEEALQAAQKKAKSYMPLTNKEIMMLRRFTESLADAFANEDIVQRLANMLNSNLELMVGPKQLQLKVRDPAKYSFQPKQLLQDLMAVYLNLRNKKSFIKAVVQDGRSYKPAIFLKARDIATRRELWDPPEMRVEWDRMCQDLFEAKEIEDNLERIMEGVDIPDDYLDPILFTLMDEPVILPSTKVRINLQTIRSHLLSDPTDPFNREPLKLEQVKPDLELKARIEDFKAERLRIYMEREGKKGLETSGEVGLEAEGSGDPMDTA